MFPILENFWRKLELMKNKRGDIGNILFVVVVLFVILFAGVIIAFGVLTTDWVADVVVPEISTLGMVGSSNLTEYAGYTIAPVNTFVQSFTWLGGVIYALIIVAAIGLSFVFRFTGNKWLMAFFIGCMFMLAIASIFISNIYEDFYNDGGDVGTRLHEQTLLSYLILYSPLIMIVVGFICGVIMFTGENDLYQNGGSV